MAVPMIIFLLLAATTAQPSPAPDIVVTGRGLGGAETATTVTIPRERLVVRANRSLDSILTDVGGVQGFRRSDARSGHPTSQSITMRGLGGNASSRALLVLDGVPQADPFGGWVPFPAFVSDRLSDVRVTRGGGSAIWGAGALAGTVEMDSAEPEDLRPFEARLAAGSHRSKEGQASFSTGSRRSFLTVSAFHGQGEGFIPIAKEDRGPADRPAGYRQSSLALRAVAEVAPATELQLNLIGFGDRRERGVPNTANRSRGADMSARLVGRGDLGWSLLAYYQRRQFASRFAAVDAARSSADLTLDQFAVPATGWGLRAEARARLAGVDIRAGADLRHTSGETRERFQFVGGNPTRQRETGGETRTVGTFLTGQVTSDEWEASIAGRLDRWWIADGQLDERSLICGTSSETTFRDRSGWVPTARAAISWASQPVTVHASAYRGWRLPTLNELYRPFRAGADATAANPSLKPETMVGVDAGVKLDLSSEAKAGLTLFVAKLKDAIANVTIAQGPGVFPGVGFVSAAGSFRRRENLDAIRTRGIEVDIEQRWKTLRTGLSYALVDARVHESGIGSAFDGRRPVQVPRHHLTASVDWDGTDRRAAGVRARWTSDQYEDDANQRRLDGALTFDAHAAHPLGKRFTLVLRGENLFDRRVESGVSERGEVERAIPRTLWAEIGFAL